MILALISFKGLEIGDYKFPYWSTIIGIVLSSSTLYGVTLYAIYFIIRYIIIGGQVGDYFITLNFFLNNKSFKIAYFVYLATNKSVASTSR